MTFLTHNSPLIFLKTNSVHSNQRAGKELSENDYY